MVAPVFDPDVYPHDRRVWHMINSNMMGWTLQERWDYLFYGEVPE
jgi:hypothetical protein